MESILLNDNLNKTFEKAFTEEKRNESTLDSVLETCLKMKLPTEAEKRKILEILKTNISSEKSAGESKGKQASFKFGPEIHKYLI